MAVAVDGSEGSQHALHWAARYADLARRPLLVVHVVSVGDVHGAVWRPLPETNVLLTTDDLPPGQDDRLDLVRDAETDALHVSPGLTTRRALVQGVPSVALRDLTRRVSLLVLGTHGHGVLRSRVLGSTSAMVVRRAHCPVAVVHEEHGSTQVARAVTTYDGTSQSARVLRYAFDVADVHGVGLTVHCLVDAASRVSAAAGVGAASRGPASGDLRRTVLDVVGDLAEAHPEVELAVLARRHHSSLAIVDHARTGDVVVLGRHEHHLLRHLLDGTEVAALLGHAHSTLVVLPKEETGAVAVPVARR